MTSHRPRRDVRPGVGRGPYVAACWMLFDLGLDPAVVADKLSHADPNFTIKRYIGVRGNPDTAAMAITDQW